MTYPTQQRVSDKNASHDLSGHQQSVNLVSGFLGFLGFEKLENQKHGYSLIEATYLYLQ
jgi:hypothetical protein